MKVLWCLNTEMPAVEKRLCKNESFFQGGWMEALRLAISKYMPDVELHIVSLTTEKYDTFTEDNSTYYGICTGMPGSTIKKVIKGWKHKSEERKYVNQIKTIIQTIDADIVHIHGVEAVFGLVIAQDNFKYPVIVSIQGIISAILPEYVNSVGIDKLFKDAGKISFIMSGGKLHQYFTLKNMMRREKYIVSKMTTAAGRTDWDRNVINNINSRIAYYSGPRVLRQPFYENKWNEDNFEKGTLITTAGGGPYKGLDDLIEAFSLLKQSTLPYLMLKIISSGQNVEEILSTIRDRNPYLSENAFRDIEILNDLCARDISKELCEASLFICPSHIDNSPNSLAEAICIGIPCIGTFVGGIPDMLSYGSYGNICSPCDVYSIIDSICEVFAQPVVTKEKARLGRIEFRRTNDSRIVAEQIVNNYTKVIANAKKTK